MPRGIDPPVFKEEALETMLQAGPKKRVAARPKSTVRAKKLVKAEATRPEHEEIACRAQALYVQSGHASGRDEEFWLEAERQLLAESKVRT